MTFPSKEQYVPEGAVTNHLEIGTGLFKTDVITVYDASKDPKSTAKDASVDVKPILSFLKSGSNDKYAELDASSLAETETPETPQPTTRRKPLVLKKIVALLPTILG